MIGEQPLRAVSGIEFDRILNIALHRIRFAVIADRAKGLFIEMKEAVGSGKSLNQILVSQFFIQIQGIHPFGIETCQHLVDHDQQIQLFFRLQSLIGFLVRQSGGNILLKSRVPADIEVLAIARIVIL